MPSVFGQIRRALDMSAALIVDYVKESGQLWYDGFVQRIDKHCGRGILGRHPAMLQQDATRQ
eukprot:ctg_4354.g654